MYMSMFFRYYETNFLKNQKKLLTLIKIVLSLWCQNNIKIVS